MSTEPESRPAPDAVHPRLLDILAAMHEAHADCTAFVRTLAPAVRDAPPVGNRWSIAQHLEHLVLVEGGSGRVIGTLIRQVREAGTLETATDSLLHSLDGFAVWTTQRPVPAPPTVQPTGTLSAIDAIDQLTEVRTRTMEALRAASGLALHSVSFPHPVLGPLSAYQWALFTAHHQQRHVAHMRHLRSPLSV